MPRYFLNHLHARKCYLLYVVTLLFALTSCSSVKIGEHPFVDVKLPNDFKSRLFIKNPAQVRDDLTDVVGRLLEINSDGTTDKIASKRLTVEGATTKVTAIENGLLYESKNNLKTDSDLALALPIGISNKTTTNSMVETLVEDIAVARISDNMLDWNQIFTVAKSIKENPTGKQYCLVTQARLTNFTMKIFRELDTQTKVAQGDVFKTGGKVYHSNSERMTDYTVSCQCLDIVSIYETSAPKRAVNLSEQEVKTETIKLMKSVMDENGNLLHSMYSTIDQKKQVIIK